MDLSDWTDIASVVTAVCSVGIAYYAVNIAKNQAIASREHNRNSVMPLLTSSTYRNCKKGFFKLVIRNSGLGPARITKFVAYYKNDVASPSNLNESYPLAMSKILHLLSVKDIAVVQIKAGHDMGVSQEHTLVELTSTKKGSQEAFQEVEDALNLVGFAIEYTDIYGNQMKPLATLVKK